MSLFSASTFEHCNHSMIVCLAHDELMVDWSERQRLDSHEPQPARRGGRGS